jgi:hypothetical protein
MTKMITDTLAKLAPTKPATAATPAPAAVKAAPAPAPKKAANGEKPKGEKPKGEKKERLRPAPRLAFQLGVIVKRLDKALARTARWGVEDLKQDLTSAQFSLKSAAESLAALPADYRAPGRGPGKAGIVVGATVLLKEKIKDSYPVAFHGDLTVDSVSGKRAFLVCGDNDTMSTVAPLSDLEVA